MWKFELNVNKERNLLNPANYDFARARSESWIINNRKLNSHHCVFACSYVELVRLRCCVHAFSNINVCVWEREREREREREKEKEREREGEN